VSVESFDDIRVVLSTGVDVVAVDEALKRFAAKAYLHHETTA
jgi:hypothetical protein